MVSLYVKFVILIVSFVCISLCLQLISWKKSTVTVRMKDNVQRSRDQETIDNTIQFQMCVGDHCVINKAVSGGKRVPNVADRSSVASKSQHGHRPEVQIVSKLYDSKKFDEQIANINNLKVMKVTRLHNLTVTHKLNTGHIHKLGIQYGDLNILSKNGYILRDEGRVGIWNTESGKDRILEQMAYIPKQISERILLKPKYILPVGGPGNWKIKPGNQTFIEHKCKVKNCQILTSDDDGDPDAILFQQFLPVMDMYIHMYRKPHIIWLMFLLESPMATPDYAELNDYINWTATYRSDSTLVTPYEKWVTHQNASSLKQPIKNYAEGKSKMVAIFVSNCAASNERLQYVHDLQKNISVDIFGFCGEKQCPRHSDECSEKLNRDYKFYLSFENANCKDYITEKFFVNGLGHDVIPVVMGARREEYEKVAPPHSFIHVEDFKSAEELAVYLQKLDGNDKLYNEYFQWKRTGSNLDTKFWCRLCSMLNEDNKPQLSIDFEKFWRPQNVCTRGRWDAL